MISCSLIAILSFDSHKYFKYISFSIELAFEQQGFELCTSTQTWIFFNCNSVILPDLLVVGSSDAEPQIWRSCIYGALAVTYTLIFVGTSKAHIVQIQLYVQKCKWDNTFSLSEMINLVSHISANRD